MPVKKAATDRRRTVKKAAAKAVSNGRVTKPAPVEITSAGEWGKEAREKRVEGRPLTVPSGKTCLVKMVNSMEKFISGGNVPNALLPMMQEAATGKGIDDKELTDLVLKSPEHMAQMFEMIDNLVIECVLQPPVAPVPQREVTTTNPLKTVWEDIPPHERPDDDTLYVDYIDLDDRLFIFNYALSGVSDLEKFRAGSTPSLELVSAVESLDESSERHPPAGE